MSAVDALHDRAVVRSQLVFGSVVVVVTFVLQLALPAIIADPAMIAGIVLTFTVTAAAILFPWHLLPTWATIVLPLADVVAVGLMRIGSPPTGVGLLWIFPTTWLARAFGSWGAVAAVGLSFGFIAYSEIVADRDWGVESVLGVVYLPITLLFVAASSAVQTRRDAAGRELLASQAKRLERALRGARSQEALVAEVLDAVEFGVLRLDRHGRATLMNRAWERMHAVERDGTDTVAAARVHDAQRNPLPDEDVPVRRAERGEEFRVLTWVRGADGRKRALDVVARSLRADDGEPDGSVLVAREVTAELEAIRARDDLISSVSHDLRTPMTSILGYLELSVDDPQLPERIRRNLEIAERNGNRVLELISVILESARDGVTEARRLDLANVDLAVLAREAVEELRPRADEAGVRVSLDAIEPVPADVDTARMRRVLDNLLSNAVKYNRAGGAVDVRVRPEGAGARIVVADTGIGIPADELPRVFERFFRSDAVRQSSTHGTGLGLGIVRDLVERMGGRIELDSTEGEGTTVTIVLAGAEERAA